MSEDLEQDIPYCTPPQITPTSEEIEESPPTLPTPERVKRLGPPPWLKKRLGNRDQKDKTMIEGCSWREEMTTHAVGAGIQTLVPRVPGKQGDRGMERTCLLLDPDPDPVPCSPPPTPDQCSLNNGGCSHNCSVAPGEGIVCSCPLGMELGPDNHTCQIQSYCAKHLKCSQKCDQNKFSVKCSCYEGWVLEPDGESCRSLGERLSGLRRGYWAGGWGVGGSAAAELQEEAEVSIWAQCQGPRSGSEARSDPITPLPRPL